MSENELLLFVCLGAMFVLYLCHIMEYCSFVKRMEGVFLAQQGVNREISNTFATILKGLKGND